MQTTKNPTLLTASDSVNLQIVLEAAQRCARVRWLDDSHPEGINEGTARHIVKSAEDIGFLTSEDDVRDGCLRITTTAGWEVFLPVREAMALVQIGGFALDS